MNLENFDKFINSDQNIDYLNTFLKQLNNRDYIIIDYFNLKILNVNGLLIYISKECYCLINNEEEVEYTIFIEDITELNLLCKYLQTRSKNK